MSDRHAFLGTSCARFTFLGGLFNARPLIIDIARLDELVEFEDTVLGVDRNKRDLRCLRSGVLGTDRASVDFLFCTPAPLPFCSAFLEVLSFDFLEDVDFVFFLMLPGEAVGFLFFVVLVMIVFGTLLLFK